MEYNKKLMELSDKYRQFFADKSPGQILVTICPYTFEIDYSEWGLPDRPLSSWNFDKEAQQFALYNKKRHDIWMDYTREIDNDYFPALSVHLGYGVHSAYYSGQEVIFGKETSWTHACIHSPDDISRLEMKVDNYWFRKIHEIAEYLIKWQEGNYAVSGFSNAGPGDMANALRGNDIFYDLYDDPEMVHTLMDKCADAVIWLESSLDKLCGRVNGGSVTANCWFPGRVPYLSADFNDLCSVENFLEYDFKYMQKVINAFDGAFVHHHAKGLHIHKAVAALKGLNLLEISLDPNMPRPVDSLPDIYEMNGGVPLMIRCHANDVYQYIHELRAARTVIMLNIDDLEQGREVMKLIRKNSII